MDQLLIDVSTPAFQTDITALTSALEASGKEPDFTSLNTQQRQDMTVWWVRQLMCQGHDSEAATCIDNAVFDDGVDEWPRLYHSWLWLVRMTIFIKSDDYILALGSAENALNVMVEVTNKRHEDFLAILASLLNTRFSAMLLHAVEASTSIYKNRTNQMNILAHYQQTTELYTAMLNEGGEEKTKEALENLIESLKNEGDLLLKMGNARGAVKFYTKCLRYQKKLSNTMGERELTLSIALAKALIRLVNRRAAAEQLLNSLLPLAQRLQATKEITEIEQLLNNRNKNHNIMTMLKGIS